MHGHSCRVEGEQTHGNTDRNGLLDECCHDTRGRYGHVDSPRLIEEPLILRVIEARDHAGDRKLRFGQQRDNEVRLIIARCGDHDIGFLNSGVAQSIG